jgi:hypothetical protein
MSDTIKLTRDERAFYQKILVDEETSLRSAERWMTIFAAMTVLFGSAFFILLIAWATA